MNTPEYNLDTLITPDGSPEIQFTPERPFLEKIGSFLILAGLAGAGIGLAICTTSAWPFLTAEQLQSAQQFGSKAIIGSGSIAFFGAGAYLLSKLYSLIL